MAEWQAAVAARRPASASFVPDSPPPQPAGQWAASFSRFRESGLVPRGLEPGLDARKTARAAESPEPLVKAGARPSAWTRLQPPPAALAWHWNWQLCRSMHLGAR